MFPALKPPLLDRKTMSNQSKMREFSWGNDDVKEALQKLRDKRMNFDEVDAFLSKTYNQKLSRRTIYYHCPATPAADVYLPEKNVLPLTSKFDKPMLGIKDGERYRKFKKQGGQYLCIDCLK
jgi:hypothetical protein